MSLGPFEKEHILVQATEIGVGEAGGDERLLGGGGMGDMDGLTIEESTLGPQIGVEAFSCPNLIHHTQHHPSSTLALVFIEGYADASGAETVYEVGGAVQRVYYPEVLFFSAMGGGTLLGNEAALGQQLVEAGDEDKVEIVLDGAEITNETAPAIYVKNPIGYSHSL